MNKFSMTLALLLLGKCAFAIDQNLERIKGATGIDLPTAQWSLPKALNQDGTIDESKMPKNSEYSKMVILGNKIINETSKYVGPQAKDPKKRFTGNNFSCSSCHANGGSVPNQLAFVGIWGRFPQYDAKENKIIALVDRINSCFQRSMNGKKMPTDAPEMMAMLTYMQWLSQGIPVGAKVEGQGLPKIDFISRAADPKKGKTIYINKCTPCHQENGLGVKNESNTGGYYIYPPLWGNDSYNTGAGVYRLIKAATFIKANMPKGSPDLSLEDAYDVAAYINLQPRPVKTGREKDFPDRRVKPLDMDVGPYDDHFSPMQHRFGPYKDMIK
ncbi:c-type cytochrome [Campylobacter sp. VicNov18]|uniref:c-type cytochrome n=1 Tax=Campylobacter bilis TaxID=2691918 RepID=UPI00130EB78A|nr:c-type cytochrome [Campylobacter bilis]MPV63533.1 c-type cytochrome [Campylobacter hepaticus]MBM0637033.1 c-type cytochrome [Campylobacter bilis]MCC8277810.1 c-type cytochrome [Campylobacter bilis]MCC8299419.1 c-type cytochrome [Campylobacter bilis]MCC8300719.1 c-type cytochrome [Campylobacter bilis]